MIQKLTALLFGGLNLRMPHSFRRKLHFGAYHLFNYPDTLVRPELLQYATGRKIPNFPRGLNIPVPSPAHQGPETRKSGLALRKGPIRPHNMIKHLPVRYFKAQKVSSHRSQAWEVSSWERNEKHEMSYQK
jgi:hypothetical protein